MQGGARAQTRAPSSRQLPESSGEKDDKERVRAGASGGGSGEQRGGGEKGGREKGRSGEEVGHVKSCVKDWTPAAVLRPRGLPIHVAKSWKRIFIQPSRKLHDFRAVALVASRRGNRRYRVAVWYPTPVGRRLQRQGHAVYVHFRDDERRVDCGLPTASCAVLYSLPYRCPGVITLGLFASFRRGHAADGPYGGWPGAPQPLLISSYGAPAIAAALCFAYGPAIPLRTYLGGGTTRSNRGRPRYTRRRGELLAVYNQWPSRPFGQYNVRLRGYHASLFFDRWTLWHRTPLCILG